MAGRPQTHALCGVYREDPAHALTFTTALLECSRHASHWHSHCRAGPLGLGTADALGPTTLLWGLFCALWNVQQHPWPGPSRCQWDPHPPSYDNQTCPPALPTCTSESLPEAVSVTLAPPARRRAPGDRKHGGLSLAVPTASKAQFKVSDQPLSGNST